MRVTQLMLSNNSLRHINQGYNRLGLLNDQITSGKKITRASQDPVVAMSGIRYRTQVIEIKQFQRNMAEVYNWMDTADATLDKTGQALHRIRELTAQASNDTYEATQRGNIAKEVQQLFEHIVSMANTKSNGKYIFNGSNTVDAPVNPDKMDIDVSKIGSPGFEEINVEIAYNGHVYKHESTNGNDITFKNKLGDTITIHDYNSDNRRIVTNQPNPRAGQEKFDQTGLEPNRIDIPLSENEIAISAVDAVSTNRQNVNIEVLKGSEIEVNINPDNVFNNALFGDLQRLIKALEDPKKTGDDITKLIANFDIHIDAVVSERAALGARVNRAELIEARLNEQEVIANKLMSNNEDVDFERVLIDLKTQEVVHRAALAVGARIMQPSLLDFLR